MQYQGIDEQRIVNTGLLPIARDLGPAARLHERRALPPPDRSASARRPAVHRHRQERQRREAAEVPRRSVLPEDRRRDGGRCSATIPDALTNTMRIAERCNVTLPKGEAHLPNFAVPAGLHASIRTSSTWCARASRSGCRGCAALEARGELRRPIADYEARLTYEIEHDQADEVPGYFLIVWDFIRYAREQRHSGRARAADRRPAASSPTACDHRRRSAALRSVLRALPEPRARDRCPISTSTSASAGAARSSPTSPRSTAARTSRRSSRSAR